MKRCELDAGNFSAREGFADIETIALHHVVTWLFNLRSRGPPYIPSRMMGNFSTKIHTHPPSVVMHRQVTYPQCFSTRHSQLQYHPKSTSPTSYHARRNLRNNDAVRTKTGLWTRRAKNAFITCLQLSQEIFLVTGATERTRETKSCVALFFSRSNDKDQHGDFVFSDAVQVDSPPLWRIRLQFGEAGEFVVHKPILSLDWTTISRMRIVSISTASYLKNTPKYKLQYFW